MGVVANLAVPILLVASFIERVFKGIFPPKHRILLYSSAPVPIIASVVRSEENKSRKNQESDIAERATVAEEAHNQPPLIHALRQTTILSRSEGIVLVTTETRRLIQVSALPDWDFIHAWKTAAGIMNKFPKRPFNLLISNTSRIPFKLPKN